MTTFTYHGRELNRFDHLYNSTHISERGVEIAVAVDFLANAPFPNVRLEVGNVLQHYELDIQSFPRIIVDLYEHGPHVENCDVFEIEGEYDQIVSISTLEHVGFDYEPKRPGGPIEAMHHLRQLLTPTGTLLVTIPVGFNPELDPLLRDLPTTRQTRLYRMPFPRLHWASRWTETPEWIPADMGYGKITPWASSVWIGEFAAA